MENQVINNNYVRIAHAWIDLKTTLLNSNKLDLDLFKETFTETFELLCQCRQQPEIDKRWMPIIINAYHFANTKCVGVDYTLQSATVLTERMLKFCVLSEGMPNETVAGMTMYILETRQEIYLDFTNPVAAIGELSKVYDKILWDRKAL